jgi:hypothetical protein
MRRTRPREPGRGLAHRRTGRRATLAALVLILTAVSGHTLVHASPNDSPLPTSPTPPSSTFCTIARAFGKTTTNLFALRPPELKAERAKFDAARSQLLLLAPRAIEHDLQRILAFDDRLFNKLANVAWNVANIQPATLTRWTIAGRNLKPASDAVIGYLDTNCGLQLAKP